MPFVRASEGHALKLTSSQRGRMASSSELVRASDVEVKESSRGITREWILDDESTRELSRSVVGPSRRSPSSTLKQQSVTRPFAKTWSDSKERARSTTTETLAGNRQKKEFAFRVKLALLLSVSLAVGAGIYGLWQNHPAGNSADQQSKTTATGPQGSESQAMSAVESSAALSTPDSFTLAPAVAIIQCHPGETFSRSFTFYNPSSRELTFEAVAQDVVLHDGRVSFVRAGSILNGMAATAVFAERFFNVKPRQSRSISVSLTAHPQTTSQGVLIQFRGTDRVAVNSTLGIAPTLGTLLLVSLERETPGGAEPAAPNLGSRLSSFKVSQWAESTDAEAGTRDTGKSLNSDPAEKGGSQP